MARENKQEAFRAATAAFNREFAEFLMSRHREQWRVKSCIFFRDSNRMRSWASCAFER